MGFLHTIKVILTIKRLSHIMKYLNVAEKNDAAKNIAAFLSRGTSRRVCFQITFYLNNIPLIALQREGLSPYNKIYEFEAQVHNQNVTMVMTSVSGHLMNYEFAANFRTWNACNPVSLFEAPIIKYCTESGEKIKVSLLMGISKCSTLLSS